ncbi:hypothetical protein KIW84_051956 [Lathyrus oleraceus]|uniref:Uncharacterized protein n=1 Tax=Pisum sativum TaxID=3888 RepID=A0A9D5AGQ5_PEA|nr:hypothetical protein KIW84_051956 [Pisum sativum]
MEVSGNAIYSLKEKLKFLKGGLRVWNNEVFRFLDLGVKEAIKELNVLDFEVENEGSVDVEEMALKRPLTTNRMLEEVDRVLIEVSFLLEDLKAVVWEGSRDKSPGPDGFNLSFFKSY